MITFTLVAILGALLVLVLVQLKKKPAAGAQKETPQAAPPVDLANLKPNDAQVGDVISVSGAGDEMSDLDFTADRGLWIEAGARRWFELSGPYRERRVTLRVGDDGTDVSVETGRRRLSIEDLGLSEEDLAQMDERQNTADNFEFDGKVWLYRLSREVRARRDDRQTLGYYYWEFREQGGPGLLAVRKAEGEPFGVALFGEINPGDVTVYRGSRS
jgi:hypothetical protein